MPTLQIPRLGQQISLMEDWEVELKSERRNAVMIETVKGPKFKLPKGHLLRVERIYIRASGWNAHEFDSVTFRSMEAPKGRFFVSLQHANGLRYSEMAAVVKEVHSLNGPPLRDDQRNYWRRGESAPTKATLLKKCNLEHILFEDAELSGYPPHPTYEYKYAPYSRSPSKLRADAQRHARNEVLREAHREEQNRVRASNKKKITTWLASHEIKASQILENLPPGWTYTVERTTLK